MKKLYRKGAVHPSPTTTKPDHLSSVLPAAILTLTTALSPEDSEVLLYLLSCSSTHPITTPSRRITSSSPSSSSSSRASNGGDHVDHLPVFSCDCFTCYGSYWARWNTSPNRQLIHEILDAYEDFLARESKSGGGGKNKRERKNNKNRNIGGSSSSNNDNKSKKGGRVGAESTQSELASPRKDEPGELDGEVGSSLGGGKGGEEAESGGSGGGGGEVAEERGSVRRFVNFIGERIWGVWN